MSQTTFAAYFPRGVIHRSLNIYLCHRSCGSSSAVLCNTWHRAVILCGVFYLIFFVTVNYSFARLCHQFSGCEQQDSHEGCEQQDSHEFPMYLFTWIHEELMG